MSFLLLQYTRSDGEVDTYHLKSGRRYHVGRGSTCEVRILDMRLSRKHCAFEYINDSWMVFDLGSTNGCKIDKQKIENTVAVSSKTKVTLGSVDILVASIQDHLDSENVEQDIEDASVVASDDAQFASDDALLPDDDEVEDAKALTASGPISDEIDEDDDREDSGVYEPTENKQTSPASSDIQEETKTVFISALGKRIGPITRSKARELKKKELQGALTEADIEDIISAD